MSCCAGVLLILPVLLAGVLVGFGSAAAQELKFGLPPVLSEAEMQAEFDPLMANLSDAIGQKATLYIAEDHADFHTQMEAGREHIGSSLPSATWVRPEAGRSGSSPRARKS